MSSSVWESRRAEGRVRTVRCCYRNGWVIIQTDQKALVRRSAGGRTTRTSTRVRVSSASRSTASARLAIAWRRGGRRPAVRDFISACRDAAAEACTAD